MKNLKKIATLSAMVFAIGTTSVLAAEVSSYETPATILSKITGRSLDSIVSEKLETGKTYGTIANDAGVLDKYKAQNIESKINNLNSQVLAGTITQAEANAIITAIEANQAICDGTGSARIGQSTGARFGSNGTGMGIRQGNGVNEGSQPMGRRTQGNGALNLRDGSCYIQ